MKSDGFFKWWQKYCSIFSKLGFIFWKRNQMEAALVMGKGIIFFLSKINCDMIETFFDNENLKW